MPGFDGTGPMGLGPMTGGGRGFCVLPLGAPPVPLTFGYTAPWFGAMRYPYQAPVYPFAYGAGIMPWWPRWGMGLGLGVGRGRGLGMGLGRGLGFRMAWPWARGRYWW
ncbi:MAG: DUF5320 domain-containing protein [Candidatus Zipacnadales bacterium]